MTLPDPLVHDGHTDLPPAPSLDQEEVDTLNSIARHYFRYREYEKSFYIFMLIYRYGNVDKNETIINLIESSYFSGNSENYEYFIRKHNKSIHQNKKGYLIISKYLLIKGKFSEAIKIFKQAINK